MFQACTLGLGAEGQAGHLQAKQRQLLTRHVGLEIMRLQKQAAEGWVGVRPVPELYTPAGGHTSFYDYPILEDTGDSIREEIFSTELKQLFILERKEG